MARHSWTVFALLLVAACGGSTSDGSEGAGGSGGSSGSAGSSGSSGVGGASTGGVGGSSGAGAVSGAGGSGAIASWQSCTGPGQCTLFATNCCGGYCTPDHPLSGWIAARSTALDEVQKQLCSDDVICPGCASFPQDNYLAVCRAQHCQAVDLRTDELSECNAHADCELRYGSSCCPGCAGSPMQIIAVSKLHPLHTEVCPPQGGECEPCLPPDFPPGTSAQCVAGHCAVVDAGGSGG